MVGRCSACDRRLTVEETTGFDVECPECREERRQGYLQNLYRERQRLMDALLSKVNEVIR